MHTSYYRKLAAAILLCASILATLTPAAFQQARAAAVPTSAHRFTFVATNEAVRDALVRFGRQFGLNVVVSDGVEGRITVSLHGATLDQALTAMLVPLGATYHTVNGVIIVRASQTIAHRTAAAPGPATVVPTVLNVTTIPVDRAADVLRGLFPRDRITVDRTANAVIVVGPSDDVGPMRAVLGGIDVANPTRPTTEAIALHYVDPRTLAGKLHGLYPNARITTGPNKTLIVEAVPADMNQIKSLISSVDITSVAPAQAVAPPQAVRVLQARPQDVARAVARQYPRLRVAVAGSSITLSGPADDVDKAKALIALIDQPSSSTRFTQVYRLHAVDAASVGSLITRSFRNATVTVDADLNALSVTATPLEQQRIADAISQLDVAAGSGASAEGAGGLQQPGTSVNAGYGPGGTSIEVVTLRAAIPGQNLAPSTSATDLATAVTQALAQAAPDLHITVPNNSTQLVLNGSPYSIRLAKQLIDQLDVAPPLVVLDTEVLELDETGQKNIGLLLPPALSTTYTEITPVSPTGGTPPPLLGIQPWTRTPISAQVVLNALMTQGHARVLADPRVTTISGHTASIRAGDQINYTTSVVNGNIGSVVTQQVQSVQTGVTLDITPVVNANDTISVTLHPTVNSLLGTNSQGIPSIANREAQTTVTLADNQTLFIGGLIQENTSRNETSIPFIGHLPLIGRLFTNYTYNFNRNELIIVITPHVLVPGTESNLPGPALPTLPSPQPLPTLPPGTKLPTASPSAAASPLAVSPVLSTPRPVASPPIPTPTAFAQTNEFHYGKPPTNTYAGMSDPPQIFYLLFKPTVLRNGTQVTVSVVTTTNVSRVTVANGGYQLPLSQVGPDKWQASYAFNAGGTSLGTSNTNLTVTAFRSDGAAASVQVPVSVSP